MSKTICELLADFKNKRILVIGDVIIDQYIYGTATGLSAETPTIVAKELETKTSIGGAFLLVRNLLELGAQVKFFTVVGDNFSLDKLRHKRLDLEVFVDDRKRTTAKKRYWVDNYKLAQFDILEEPSIPERHTKIFAHKLESIGLYDRLVVSDYRHGLMTPYVISQILAAGIEFDIPVYVDSQISRKTYSESNYELYKGADVFCMNLREAQFTDPTVYLPTSAKESCSDDIPIACSAFSQLTKKLDSGNILVKLGERGCHARVGDREFYETGYKVNTVDTCGAGDAFLAALSLCDIEKAPAESLKIANAWAALSTTIHGTEPAKLKQLLDLLAAESRNSV